MPYARKVGGSWEELTGAFTVGDMQYPADWPEMATADELAALDIHPITEAGPEPVDVAVTGMALTGDDLPHRVYETRPFTAGELDDLKARLVAQVNDEAGAFRRRFITAIPGQETTYILKEAEAKAWSADADHAQFPYLTEEAARTGMTLPDLVALVLATAAQWRAIDPKVEGLRRGASVGIAVAPDAASARAAAAVDWNDALPA